MKIISLGDFLVKNLLLDIIISFTPISVSQRIR